MLKQSSSWSILGLNFKMWHVLSVGNSRGRTLLGPSGTIARLPLVSSWSALGFGFWKSECPFLGTKMLGLKDGSELSSLCNSKSFSAPELDSVHLKGAVLLVAAARLKIQPPCTEIRALSCAGKPGSSFDCQVLQGLAGMLTYPGTALLAQYQNWNWGTCKVSCKLFLQLSFTWGLC